MKFIEMNLSKEILSSLEDYGFEFATKIQAEAIPLAMAGKDIIGQAQTGTGKTAAFGIPLIEKSDVDVKHAQHLVLAPTRELASQIKKELAELSKYKDINIVEIYGGTSYSKQLDALKNRPHIVVGTPGRIKDLIDKKKLSIKQLKSFTLDEADEMLAFGFIDEIKEIIDMIPAEAQRFMFTATMNKKIKVIADALSTDAESISVSSGLASTKNIEQKYMVLKENQKFITLSRLLDMNKEGQSVIFGRTKKRVDELYHALTKCGYNAAGIQGDMSQSNRSSVMQRFKNNEIDILVATDVAARGIDVKNVVYVYNFDLPDQVEYYTHRIGRCGRAGKEGHSYSFARETEVVYIEHIENATKSVIEPIKIPTQTEAQQANTSWIIEDMEKTLKKSKFKIDSPLIISLMEKFDATDLAIIIADFANQNKKIYDINLSSEPPVWFNPVTKKATSRRGGGSGGSSGGGGSSRKRRDRGSSDGNKRWSKDKKSSGSRDNKKSDSGNYKKRDFKKSGSRDRSSSKKRG